MCPHYSQGLQVTVLIRRGFQYVTLYQPCIRPHNNRRHLRPLAFCAPTNGLGALESSILFCYSLTCNCLGALSCPFKMAWKMGALQNPYFKACLVSLLPVNQNMVFRLFVALGPVFSGDGLL